MADTGIGDLVILVGADLSAFEDALAQIPTAAAKVSQELDSAFFQSSSVDALTTGVQHLEQTLGDLSEPLTTVAENANAASESLGTLESSTANIQAAVTEAAGAANDEF